MAMMIHTITLLATIFGLAYLGFMVLGAYRRQAHISQLHQDEREMFKARLDLITTPLAKVANDKTQAWSGFRKFRVDGKVLEAESCCSFYLAPHDGRPLPAYLPGQYLTFRLQIPGQPKELTRCYSLSDSPDHSDYYRVTIKRIPPPGNKPDAPPGVVSGHFHERIQVGDILDVKAPSGHFHLDPEHRNPVVLVGGGIGVTPALSMLNYLATAPSKREVWFFYGIRNSREHMLRDALQEIAAEHENIHIVVCYSDPLPDEQIGEDYHYGERVSVDLFKRVLGVNNFDYYICGPAPMMESLTKGLTDWGVPEKRIHFEAFGPASVKKATKSDQAGSGTEAADTNRIEVTFTRSNKKLMWSNSAGSLLEFAEANGISMDSGCRAGSCGTCATAIRDGQVDYLRDPDFDIEKGSCLACVAVPKGTAPLSLDA